MDARAILAKTGRPYDKTSRLKTLHNKVYRGLAVHKGNAFPASTTRSSIRHYETRCMRLSRTTGPGGLPLPRNFNLRYCAG